MARPNLQISVFPSPFSIFLLALLALPGCAAYRVGAHSLYQPDVETVYVPIFESNSFRRYLGERLTEAVVKEIELKTPFKVVDSANADSILSGRILRDSKRVLVESSFDDARELQLDLVVQVSWLNRRGDLIRQQQAIPIEAQLVEIARSASYVPEAGQSITTGQQQSINRLAEQIVALMEAPW